MAYRFSTRAKISLPPGLFLACRVEAKRYEAVDTMRRLVADRENGAAVDLAFTGPYHALWIFEHVPECRPSVRKFLRRLLEE